MLTPVTTEVYLNQATDDDMSVFCPFGFVFAWTKWGLNSMQQGKKVQWLHKSDVWNTKIHSLFSVGLLKRMSCVCSVGETKSFIHKTQHLCCF